VIATLSSRGQIVIPQAVRERCGFGEGDHFVIEDDPETQVVVLRKVKNPGQWFEVYMQCPDSFAVPARRSRIAS
jgi:AbrB family looped-hinge helix DNA binding protein